MTSLTPSLPVIPPEVFTVFGWYVFGGPVIPPNLTWFRWLEASSSFKAAKTKIQILRHPSLGQQARKLCTRPRFADIFRWKKSCAGGLAGNKCIEKRLQFFCGAILLGYLFKVVVSTQLQNISQIGSFPKVGVKREIIRNHHLVLVWSPRWAVFFCVKVSNMWKITATSQHPHNTCLYAARENHSNWP